MSPLEELQYDVLYWERELDSLDEQAKLIGSLGAPKEVVREFNRAYRRASLELELAVEALHLHWWHRPANG